MYLSCGNTFCHLIQLFLQVLAGRISRGHIARKFCDRIPELAANPLKLGKFRLFYQSGNCRLLHNLIRICNRNV